MKTNVSFPELEPLAAPCPACGSGDLQLLYVQRSIPVNSCLLMRDADEARSFPTGDQRLALCTSCGFLTNTAFDPRASEYSARYEETQAFSGTFNAFARRLAERLVRDYGIHGKTVLEIGCGKGEFLVQLCELGANRGIGIDPGYHPERTASPAAERIEFIRDFYDGRSAHLRADVYCCRHTLEHIAPTREFMTALRKNLEGQPDALVFFEIPDALRVLREGAFWDIYYEHCSYFTPGSLARLFRATGFELLELSLDYDDQYVLLVARPAPGPSDPSLALEQDLPATCEAAARFAKTCGAKVEHWRRLIAAETAAGRRTILWGSGSKAVSFLTTLGDPPIDVITDVNPFRHGRYMPGTGQRIVAPSELRDYRPDTVIAMNPIYRQEIQRSLCELGLPQARLLTL